VRKVFLGFLHIQFFAGTCTFSYAVFDLGMGIRLIVKICTDLIQLFSTVKIGRPGYRVTKQFDQDTRQRSLLFQVKVFHGFF